MSSSDSLTSPKTSRTSSRVERADWERLGTDLAQGFAVIEGLLGAADCRSIAALYPDDARFRSRIVMARHGFGRGEYKYFAYPLPELDRRAAHGALSAAGRDRQPLERGDGHRRALSRPSTRHSSSAATTPARRGRRRCCCSTAPATSTACTRTSTASTCSRCRSPILLSEPGRDFTGGEFVLTEQRPRMQSRAEVVPLRQRRRRGLRGPSPPGAGHARRLPRQPAPRRQPRALRPSAHARASSSTTRSKG